MPNFEDLGLKPTLLRSLREMGFEEPTPVQARAIPKLMEGHDVVAQALTGTGKTAAYGIPLAARLQPRLNRPQAVVLAPTRELALQVAEHLEQLGRYLNLRFLPIYGGQPIERQLTALRRGVHGIVATPGRLMDHMRRGSVDLSEVRMLVLDEADQMLQMGFQEDVDYIVSHLPEERLTALFSATMPKPILDIVKNYMREPEMIQLSQPHALTVPSVEQSFFIVPFPRKFDALCRILDARAAERTIVFCATKRMVDEITERLPTRGYAAQALHGDVTQSGRERVLKAFRDGRCDVLVATDVAARGLDIPDVALVVNFDIPPDPEYYVHRIGRTARFGQSGEAITFVNPREMRELQVIERTTGAHIKRGELPTPQEAEERESQQLTARLREALEKNRWQPFLAMVEELSEERDPIEVAAAALSMVAERRASGRSSGAESTEQRSEGRPTSRRESYSERPGRDDAGSDGGAARKHRPFARPTFGAGKGKNARKTKQRSDFSPPARGKFQPTAKRATKTP